MTPVGTFAGVVFVLWAIALMHAGMHGPRWAFELLATIPWAMLAYTLGWWMFGYARGRR